MIAYNRNMSESTSLQNPGTPSWKKRCCHSNNSDGFTIISFCFFVFTIAVTGSLIIQIHFGTSEVTPHGAVASDDLACSEIGIHTIRDGGSAADATIASLLCLSVTQPHVVGPGGGGVILTHDHKLNSTKILDFMVSFSSGNSSTGVPGFLKGLEKLHKLHGKLPFKDLFQPAIKLARQGFKVSKQLSEALNNENAARFTSNFQGVFFPKGIAPSEGQILFRRKYADFLEVVAVGGADELHLYKYGTEMVKAFHALGSNVSVHDFHNYEVIERKVVKERIFNVSIFTIGPPFGGLQVVAGLELMKELGIGSHTLPEQLYDAFTQGLLLGTALTKTKFTSDADFLNETLSLTSKLTSHGFALSDLPPPTISEPVASQVSAVDTFDLYVAAIVGLGDSFGSGFMTEDGIILNQDSSDSAKRGEPNFDGRHITSFTPLIATDTHNICGDRIVLSSGSWGALLQTCTQLIFRNLDMASAIDEPRIALGTEPKVLLLNDFNLLVKRVSPSVREHLKEKSHFKLRGLFVPLGVNGVSKHKDTLVSHSDTRGGGVAARLHQKGAPTNLSDSDL